MYLGMHQVTFNGDIETLEEQKGIPEIPAIKRHRHDK